MNRINGLWQKDDLSRELTWPLVEAQNYVGSSAPGGGSYGLNRFVQPQRVTIV